MNHKKNNNKLPALLHAWIVALSLVFLTKKPAVLSVLISAGHGIQCWLDCSHWHSKNKNCDHSCKSCSIGRWQKQGRHLGKLVSFHGDVEGGTVSSFEAEEKNNTSAYLFFGFIRVHCAPLLHHGQKQICRNRLHLVKLQSAQTFKKECLKDFRKKKL